MPVPAIFDSLKSDFVLIAQYTDSKDDPKPAKVFQEYSPQGGSVPVYLILDSRGNEMARLGWPSDRPNMTKEEFLQFMKDGLAKAKKANEAYAKAKPAEENSTETSTK